MKFLFLSVFVLVTACSCGKNKQSEAGGALGAVSCKESYVADQYPLLRAYIISLRPALENEKNKEVIERTIRDLVYLEFTFGGNMKAPLMESYDGWKMMVEDKTSEYRCWGTTFLYRQALHAFGIPSRSVGLARDIQPGYTHATSEAFLNGKWVVSDSTFNIHLTRNGKRIGYKEAVEQGYTIERGVHNLAGKDLDNWAFQDPEFISYLNHVNIRPGPGEGFGTIYLFPLGWDGKIMNNAGEWKINLITDSKAEMLLNEAYEVQQCRGM